MEISKEHRDELDKLIADLSKKIKDVENPSEEDKIKWTDELFSRSEEISEKYKHEIEPIDHKGRKVVGYDLETFEPMYEK